MIRKIFVLAFVLGLLSILAPAQTSILPQNNIWSGTNTHNGNVVFNNTVTFNGTVVDSALPAGCLELVGGILTSTGGTCGSGSGGGNVFGPGSSVNGDLAGWNGTSGTTLTDSGIPTNNVVTQLSGGAANEVCTYTAANKICVPAQVPNGALVNSSITLNGTANQITSPGATALGGTAVFSIANPFVFPGKFTGVASATGAASANIPSGVAPTSPLGGDLWNLSGVLQFFDGAHTNSLTTIQAAPTTGHCVQFSNTLGLLADAGGACTVGGSGINIQVNGGANLTGPANFQNGPVINGITINVSNPSGSNVQSQISGILNAGGGGTGLNTSGSTGVPVLTAGTWSITTTPNYPNSYLQNSTINIAGTSVSLGGSTSSFPSPGTIGGTTPGAGFFTTGSFTGNLTTNMTGGPFCVHETSGILSATGTDCGSGGGGVSASGTPVNQQVAIWTSASAIEGLNYLPASIHGYPDTRSDTGTYALGGGSPNACGRIQDLAVASTAIDARDDQQAAFWPCGAVNIDPLVQNARNTVLLGTGNGTISSTYATDVSQTLSAYDVLIGNPTVLVGGGVGTNPSNGTMFEASSVFPGNTFQVFCTGGTCSAGHAALKSGAAGSASIPTLVGPGWRFVVAGEVAPVTGIPLPFHRVLPCQGQAAPCYLATGVPSAQCVSSLCYSSYYSMPNSTTIADSTTGFTFVPAINGVACSSGTPCTLTFLAPIISIGDATSLNQATQGGSPACGNCNNALTGVQVKGLTVTGGSANGYCIGGENLLGQENSYFRDYYVTNCGIGFLLEGQQSGQGSPDNSGDDANINVNVSPTFASLYGTTAPVTLVELDGGYYDMHRMTINAAPLGTLANVTSFTGTSGTLTFTNTGVNNFTAGGTAFLFGFTGGNTGLNGQAVTVLAAGLTNTTFEAAVTGSGYASGAGSAGSGAAQLAYGVFHITNAPGTNYGNGGRIHIYDFHIEGCDNSVCGGNTIATGTQDCIFIDTQSSYPSNTTGEITIDDFNTASGTHSCVNAIHVASNFVGTLNAASISCGTGNTNIIKDDINGNVIQCAHNLPGAGFYNLDSSGAAFTNMNCTDLTKGWCLFGGEYFFYMNGSTTGMKLYNTNAATVLTTRASPIIDLGANYWTGSASVEDDWTIQTSLAAGANAQSTLTFAHSGSTGTAFTQFPGPVAAGSGGGVGGALVLPEGTTVSGAATQDILWGDSTNHCAHQNFNNVDIGCSVGGGTAAVVSGDLAAYNGTTGFRIQDSNVVAANVVTQSSNAAAGQICTYTGANKVCVPSATPTLGASGTLGSLTFGNATSGLLTLQPATGAITSYTIDLPVAQPTAGNTFLSCTAANPTVCSFVAGGGTPAESSITGATAAASITETGATFAITRAGVETANLRYPWVMQNTNTTNTTSGALAVYTAGAGNAQVPLLVLQNSAAGDLADFGAGTLTNGLASSITLASSVLANGSYQAKGTTAGFWAVSQGTTSSAVAPCNVANTHCFQAGTATTASVETDAPAVAQGIRIGVGNSAAITDGYSGDANHSATVSWSTATSVGSTSLCSTTFCPVGTYRVSGYIDVTTACTTTGSYVVNLIYTDDTTVSKTVVIPFYGLGFTTSFGPTAVTSTLVPVSTTDYGSIIPFTIHSTGAASINYSTTAAACATGGPGVGKLYLTVEPIQ